jgi:hypothetical protein
MVGEQAHAVVGPRVALSRTPRAVASASGTVGLEGVEGVFEGLGDPTPRPGFVIDAPAADRARSLAGRDAGRRPVRQMLPTVALANNGQAVAAWQRGLGNTGIVEGAAFSAGGAAGPATQLSQPAAAEAFPDLAGNPKGDAVVAWGQETDGGAGMTVQAARFCRHCRR